MNPPDYRALCAELSDAYLRALEHINNGAWLGYEPSDDPLITRARAALAQPGAEGPSVELVAQIIYENAMVALPRGRTSRPWPSWSALPNTDVRIHALNTAEIILANWGRPTPQPIPVSERLPGEGDCDAEGRCWLLGKVESDWRLISAANPGIPHLRYAFSHWLPHWALPLPAAPAAEKVQP
jgi:hypothetical protein